VGEGAEEAPAAVDADSCCVLFHLKPANVVAVMLLPFPLLINMCSQERKKEALLKGPALAPERLLGSWKQAAGLSPEASVDPCVGSQSIRHKCLLGGPFASEVACGEGSHLKEQGDCAVPVSVCGVRTPELIEGQERRSKSTGAAMFRLLLSLSLARLAVVFCNRASPSQFLAWCKSSGISAPKCSMHTFPSGLRGVIALEDITAGSTVVEVPLEICFLKRGSEEGKWPVDLALSLAEEMEKGRESAWFPYLSTLPSASDLSELLPVNWGAEEIGDGFSTDMVFDDDVKNAVETSSIWRDTVWNEYSYSRSKEEEEDARVSRGGALPDTRRLKASVLPGAAPEDTRGGAGEEKKATQAKKSKVSRSVFDHALDLVQTRNCCPSPDMHLVVPFFDLLNHDPRAETEISLSSSGTVRLVTGKAIKRGEEVCLNYHLDSQLLSPFALQGEAAAYPMDLAAYAFVSYGFVPSVDETSILLPLSTIREALLDANSAVIAGAGGSGSRPGSALSILEACGLQISQPFTVYRDGVALSLLAVLRVLSASEEERQRLWGAGVGAVREEVLRADGVVAGPVRERLASLLLEERARHEEVLAEDDAAAATAGLRRPLRVRKQASRVAVGVIDDCLKWAGSLRT